MARLLPRLDQALTFARAATISRGEKQFSRAKTELGSAIDDLHPDLWAAAVDPNHDLWPALKDQPPGEPSDPPSPDETAGKLRETLELMRWGRELGLNETDIEELAKRFESVSPLIVAYRGVIRRARAGALEMSLAVEALGLDLEATDDPDKLAKLGRRVGLALVLAEVLGNFATGMSPEEFGRVASLEMAVVGVVGLAMTQYSARVERRLKRDFAPERDLRPKRNIDGGIGM